MSEAAIEASSLSLAYKLYRKPVDLLAEVVLGKVRHDTFWALKDVSIRIEEGERVGVVGPNGAGKSSLLQVITGNIAPTTGSLRVNGKISSLLSLTPAWNLEDTGLENIKFNLLLQGVPAKRIPALTEDIIDFTDLGAFIFQPVKTYSSGMSARLAFAIATAIDPEILIIDEVLGTGDGYFAARAFRRMQEMCARGKALLFVSHATAAIRQLCDKCLWMENGTTRAFGPTETILRQYEEDMLRQDEATLREGNRKRIRALKDLAAPEDLTADRSMRFRIRPEHGRDLRDTHYIRDINIRVGDNSHSVSLYPEDVRKDETFAALDLLSCEWGRIFERGALECRTLQPRAGMRKGGYIIAKVDGAAARQQVEISIVSASLAGLEPLVIDRLDYETGAWVALDTTRTTLGDGWTRARAVGEVGVATTEKIAEIRKSAEERFRKPVEITNVQVFVKGESSASVDEFTPFVVRVACEHHEALPAVSIGLNILRSDGVYVFYQPSGWDKKNISNHLGKSSTDFVFDPNLLGAGDYEINVFAVNGFAWDNIPPSEIFDRSLGICRFKVNQVRPIVFGLINKMVDVRTELEPPPLAVAGSPDVLVRDRLEKVLPGVGAVLAIPPPYKRMVAFNSDIEFTTWAAQKDLFRMFAERNLETAFSYWLFGDPKLTWRLMTPEGEWSNEAPAALELARRGLLDTLHSFGGVAHGTGTAFDRRNIELGYRLIESQGVRTEIFSNHGTILDVQNIGGPWSKPKVAPIDGSNYWEGDLVGYPSYHADLTRAHGVRFYWCDVDCIPDRSYFTAANSVESAAGIFAPQIARDGGAMLRFRRTNFGVRAWPCDFARQLDSVLSNRDGQYSVVYNHFGYTRTNEDKPANNERPYFTDEAIERLDDLARAERDGDILVTTTSRLLNYAFVQAAQPWRITHTESGTEITFDEKGTVGDVTLPLRWSDYEGIAVEISDDLPVILRLGVETRPADRWRIGAKSFAGIKWRKLEMGRILDDAFRLG